MSRMNRINRSSAASLLTRTAVLTTTLVVAGAVVAEAQRPIAGFPRSDQTDVTGPAVTSGDQMAAMFTEPGTIRSMFCPVAWGVRTATQTVQQRLAGATLQPALLVGGTEIGSTAQLRVLSVMSTPGGDREAADHIVNALVQGNNPGARRAARRLVDEVRGLFPVVERMDPLRPGEAGPTRLTRAVAAYNGFIDASAESFLRSPAQEMTAIHSVLNHLVIASLENEGREARADVVDQAGLACAMLFPPVPAAPPPPVEQAIEMCVMVDGEFRNIAMLRRPDTGETMVLVNGERQPLAAVYPTATVVPSPEWVSRGEAITIGTTNYQPFGVTRAASPGELSRRGQVQGHDYFTAPNESITSPTVVYFLAGPECVVQPYRSAETIRVRG
jgi:hypothetical protein